MGKPTVKLGEAEAASATIAFDQSAIVELSASLADADRWGFAESFSAAAVAAYWQLMNSGAPLPGALQRLRGAHDAVLTPEWHSSACALALEMQPMSTAGAAYTVGALYTALLPARLRAERGLFYTPPRLVQFLLAMVEETGIDWTTASSIPHVEEGHS